MILSLLKNFIFYFSLALMKEIINISKVNKHKIKKSYIYLLKLYKIITGVKIASLYFTIKLKNRNISSIKRDKLK